MTVFKKILLPVDLAHEEQIEEQIKVAVAIANNEEAEIHMLYVDQSLIHRAGYPHLSKKNVMDHQGDAVKKIDVFLNKLPKNLKGGSLCREGTAHDQIVETAEELGVDAIILMAQKPGISSYFIGSNAERVVRHAHCSVFVIRED